MDCCRITELRHKEVINSTNGCRIGFVDDVEINTANAKVLSLVIYGRQRFLGFFGRREEIVIKWENIQLIGEDTILISHCPYSFQNHKKTKNHFFHFLNG